LPRHWDPEHPRPPRRRARGDEYAVDANDNFDEFEHADDLIRYIASSMATTSVSVWRATPRLTPTRRVESDLHYLKVKVDAGADFIITQLFYDIGEFERWVTGVRGAGECGDGGLAL
jgi:methylenetetrahydrofolate reductase (NADPH)